MKKFYLLSISLVMIVFLCTGIFCFTGMKSQSIMGEEISWEDELNPFTGKIIEEFDLATRPVLFSIDNAFAARPQSGLKEADIIYEVPVEGGITRFLALFYGHLPVKVGPIRSVRPYMVEIARENEGLLVHAGASQGGYLKIKELEQLHLDEIYQGSYFWREYGQRKPPHNLFTGQVKLEDFIKILPSFSFRSRFSFIKNTPQKTGNNGLETVKISFFGKEITYRLKEGQWKRVIDGKKDLEINCSNLVIRFVEIAKIPGDSAGRLKINLNGSGKALVFKEGEVINGKWIKKSRGWTAFLDKNGTEIKFVAGRTWIILVPVNAKVTYR